MIYQRALSVCISDPNRKTYCLFRHQKRIRGNFRRKSRRKNNRLFWTLFAWAAEPLASSFHRLNAVAEVISQFPPHRVALSPGKVRLFPRALIERHNAVGDFLCPRTERTTGGDVADLSGLHCSKALHICFPRTIECFPAIG